MRCLLPLIVLPLAACSRVPEKAAGGADPASSALVAIAPAATPRAGAPIAPDAAGPGVRTTDTKTIVDLPSDVLFAYDSDVLAATAAPRLRHAAELIAAGAPGTVTVTGYADGKGEAAYNLALSRRRAAAVGAWLAASGGIARDRLAIEGRGAADPVAPNTKLDGSDDPAGRARNRRVQIEIPRAG